MITVIDDLKCPICGAEEDHPDDGCIQIRGCKVHDQGRWWSQCLICSGGYDKIGGTFTEVNHDSAKGWF